VRAKQLEADLLVAFDQWKRAEVDLTCYKRQQDQERRALKQRLAIRRFYRIPYISELCVLNTLIWNETIKARVTRSGAEGAASTEQIRRYPSILKIGGIQQLSSDGLHS
jgi:hypothetical protein